MAKPTRSEMETTIVWDQEEKIARIYSSNPVTIRKLDRLCEQFPDEYRCIWFDGSILAKKYTVDAKFIRFGKPASEAKRTAASERARRMREKRFDYQEENDDCDSDEEIDVDE